MRRTGRENCIRVIGTFQKQDFSNAQEIYTALTDVKIYRRMITGGGGWGIYAIMLGFVPGSMLVRIAAPQVDEQMRFLLSLTFVPIFYGLLHILSRASYSNKLKEAETRVASLLLKTEEDHLHRALFVVRTCEPELLEELPKGIQKEFWQRVDNNWFLPEVI